STQTHVDLNGANGANRTFRLQTAGSNRWSFGTNTTLETAPVTATAAAAVAAGNNVVPVATTAGISSGMQVSVSGVTSNTIVSSAVGTASITPTASATISSGS